MDIDTARSLSFSEIRKIYQFHLQSLELGRNTVGTILGDTFYLWNNEGKDVFWDTVSAEDFELTAKDVLRKALTAHSGGKVDGLLNGYVANLRRFKEFILSHDSPASEKDDVTALKDFLMDIECLDPLSEWTGRFNLFDILKISRMEIRHSNMLSWLLSPNENHGLGDSILRGFIQFVVSSFSGDEDVFSTLLMDCRDFVVYREWHNIDILAVSDKEKYVLCIENKIDSGEHDNQLDRYKRQVEEAYPNYRKMFIFLSPKGMDASDTENWCSMGYDAVLGIIENVRKKVKLLPEVQLLIDNYVDTIRRDIVGDRRLEEICAEIYAKHQKALDLIFENRPDRAMELAKIIQIWAEEKSAKGELEYVPDKSGKTYTRFMTRLMSEILPDAEHAESGWGTKNYYFYEVRNNDGKEFYIQLSVSSKSIPENLRAVCDRINEFFPARQKKKNWQWRTHFSSHHAKVDEELSKEKVYEQLDKRFEEARAFESKLLEALRQPTME